jgi:hypothetical protein
MAFGEGIGQPQQVGLPQNRFTSKSGSAITLASVGSQAAGITTPVNVTLSTLAGAFGITNPITSLNKPSLLILQSQLSGISNVAGRGSITITDSTGFLAFGGINQAVVVQNGTALDITMWVVLVDVDQLIINLITNSGNTGSMSLSLQLYGWLH